MDPLSFGATLFSNPLAGFTLPSGGGFLSGVKNFFGKLFGGVSPYSIGQDIFNIFQQEKQNERTMDLQRMLWERDDTAVSRLMKQYEDNNINPLLAVPGISQGNTKGFETSALQSKANYEAERMAREQYNLNKQRQELELKIMSAENTRKNAELESDLKTKSYEQQLLRARVNGAKRYAKTYAGGLGYEDDGYIPPYAQNDYEKLASAIMSLLNKVDGDKFPKLTNNVPDAIKNDPSVEQPHPIVSPNKFKYNGKTFEYDPKTNKYIYDGKSYNELMTVKNLIDYSYEKKQETRQKQMFQWDPSFYEPMYLYQ